MCYNFFMHSEDSKKVNRLLKTAKGQIDGILKMIDEGRECIEINTQLLATISILKKVNIEVLSCHIDHCVRDAFEHGEESEKQAKIEEAIAIINKLLK